VKGQKFVAYGLGVDDQRGDGERELSVAGGGDHYHGGLFVVLVNRVFWKRMYRVAEESVSVECVSALRRRQNSITGVSPVESRRYSGKCTGETPQSSEIRPARH